VRNTPKVFFNTPKVILITPKVIFNTPKVFYVTPKVIFGGKNSTISLCCPSCPSCRLNKNRLKIPFRLAKYAKTVAKSTKSA
jgi:hypothetical protein